MILFDVRQVCRNFVFGILFLYFFFYVMLYLLRSPILYIYRYENFENIHHFPIYLFEETHAKFRPNILSI